MAVTFYMLLILLGKEEKESPKESDDIYSDLKISSPFSFIDHWY